MDEPPIILTVDDETSALRVDVDPAYLEREVMRLDQTLDVFLRGAECGMFDGVASSPQLEASRLSKHVTRNENGGLSWLCDWRRVDPGAYRILCNMLAYRQQPLRVTARGVASLGAGANPFSRIPYPARTPTPFTIEDELPEPMGPEATFRVVLVEPPSSMALERICSVLGACQAVVDFHGFIEPDKSASDPGSEVFGESYLVAPEIVEHVLYGCSGHAVEMVNGFASALVRLHPTDAQIACLEVD